MGANSRSTLPGLTWQSINFVKLLAKKMDARVKPAHDSQVLPRTRQLRLSPSLRRDHAQPLGLALRARLAAPEPDLHAVEIKINDRRGVERQQLAQRETADHGVAERLAQLRARAVTERERKPAASPRLSSSGSGGSAAGRLRGSRRSAACDRRVRPRSRSPPA